VLCVFLMSLDLSDFVSRCFWFAAQICPSMFTPALDLVPRVESVGFVFPEPRLLCPQLVSSSRFVAACGALPSDHGLRSVSFTEHAVRRQSSVRSPTWAGLSLVVFRSSCTGFLFFACLLLGLQSQLLLSCVGSFLGAHVGLVFSVRCCNQDLVPSGQVFCHLIFLRVKTPAPVLSLHVQFF
jgi:hypothetical protein